MSNKATGVMLMLISSVEYKGASSAMEMLFLLVFLGSSVDSSFKTAENGEKCPDPQSKNVFSVK